MYNEDTDAFSAKVRKNGNSYIITIPVESIEKLSLTTGAGIDVSIRKWKGGQQ